MEQTIKQRQEIDARWQWATTDLFATDEAWEAAYAQCEAQLPALAAYAGKLGSAEGLYGYLTARDAAMDQLERVYQYASLRSDEDTRVAKYQDYDSKVSRLATKFESACAFQAPELMAIDDDTLEGFYTAVPALEDYRRYLTDQRRFRAHTLSQAEEALLAAAGDMAGTPYSIFNMLANADRRFADATDSEGKSHKLTNGTLVPLMSQGDRVLRKSAFDNYYRTLDEQKNTSAALLAGQMKQLQFYADSSRYPSALAASLYHNNVPEAVYHNLIDAVHENMGAMHRYVRLRKKLLGLDELHMYDVYAPMVPDADSAFPYEQAKQIVYDALAPLGEDYRAILKEGFDNRWIDVYENAGKRSGAYSSGGRVHPFVLLNYHEQLDDVFTLAHEMGHAIHSYLSSHTQKPIDSEYVIFVAEVASTCNEALLMEHLLKITTDRRQRAVLINHFLEQFKGTLYRQTMFAEFERACGRLTQQGETMTAERLNSLYYDLNKAYFGPDMVSDEAIALEWSRIPHFYMNYYVFQYATGYAAAIALSRRILREGAPAVKDYLGFLSGGCSKSPIDLLKGAGVDMTTTAPIADALKLFDELISEMESLTDAL